QIPFYVEDDRDIALLLVRRLPVPGLRSWTTRVKMYVNDGQQAFVWRVLDRLAEIGAGYVVLGDSVWPLPAHLCGDGAGFMVNQHHRIVHDLGPGEASALAAMHTKA